MERKELIRTLKQSSEIMSVLSPTSNYKEQRERVNEWFREYDRLEPKPPLKFVSPVPDAAGRFLLRCTGCDDLVPIPRCGEVFRCHACGTTATAIEVETEYENRMGK